jgi:hypothetical protein
VPVDGDRVEVGERKTCLGAQHACELVFEDDALPDENLAEQPAILRPLRERLVQLLLGQQALLDEQRAEPRAQLVLEEVVVQPVASHRPSYRPRERIP